MAVGKGRHCPRVGAVPYQALPLLYVNIRACVNKEKEREGLGTRLQSQLLVINELSRGITGTKVLKRFDPRIFFGRCN